MSLGTLRVGVDIGGTFTDFALYDESTGRMLTHKQLTSSRDPSVAVLDGIAHLLREHALPIGALADVVHGTTLVINAVIERKGAPTAMIVTKGFRDLPDMGREHRYDIYDLRIQFPKPLVPRELRYEVEERIHYDGAVLKPLDLAGFKMGFRGWLKDHAAVEAVAVCLLHSYINGDHEAAIRDWLAAEFPALHISISSEVVPYIREFERWTTASVNAFVQPMVDRYLGRLESGLAAMGFGGQFHLMTSSGGTLDATNSRRFPVRLLESGPAAGALMSARIGRQMGVDHLLSFDMGGTTAKGCIVSDGELLRTYDYEVARVHEFKKGSGLPIKIPVIDMIEIGAGGGSIAEIDERGVLRVGPRSAGADPGPACYDQGGRWATLTDANLALGYLDPASFLGGKMRIEPGLATAAIREHVATPLRMETMDAAWGIHAVINENVARAFRVHASERGIDYRRCSMVAFGGSGPIHALRIARTLGIPRVICPPGAGVMSAMGLLMSPTSFETGQTHRVALGDLTAPEFARILSSLEARARDVLVSGGVAREKIRYIRRLDMRYVGQGYELEVPLPDGDAAMLFPDVLRLYYRTYEAIFSKSFVDQTVEIVNWKVEAIADGPALETRYRIARTAVGADGARPTRPVYFPDRKGFVDCPVYDRRTLVAGTRITGPALIEETESTCVVGPGDSVEIDAELNLIANIRDGGHGD